MNDIVKEAIEAVVVLNEDVEYIKFLGCTLWASEDDEREFFEDKNKYESASTR